MSLPYTRVQVPVARSAEATCHRRVDGRAVDLGTGRRLTCAAVTAGRYRDVAANVLAKLMRHWRPRLESQPGQQMDI